MPLEIAEAIRVLAKLSESDFENLSEGAWNTWHDRFQADVNFKRLVDHMLKPSASEKS
jgi:Fe-S cluster biosynthesis and repair protein YggX